MSTLTSRLRTLQVFLVLLWRNYREDGCSSTAAALTYQTLFAVVPLLTITYTLMNAFEGFSGLGDQLQDFLFTNVVPENLSMIQGYVQGFSDQAKNLSVPSLVVLIMAAFMMMFTIEKSFNEIWRVQEPRQGFQRILMYWAILTVGAPLMGLGIFITTYIISLPLFTEVTRSTGLLHLVPIFLNSIVFTLMYITVPNCTVPLRHGILGAVVVAVAFELVKQFFGSIMSRFDFEVIYGTFAAVPLFLIWLYVSWAIVLFGAELTKNMGLFRSKRSTELEEPLIQVLIILQRFFVAHQKGEVVTEKDLAKLGHRVDMQMWHEYKSRLLNLGLIRSVERGGLVLSKDLNEVSFWQLYQDLPWPLPKEFINDASAWEQKVGDILDVLYVARHDAMQMNLETLYRGTDANAN